MLKMEAVKNGAIKFLKVLKIIRDTTCFTLGLAIATW